MSQRAPLLALATALLALPGCVLLIEPGVSTEIVPATASGGHQADAAKKLVNVLVIGEPLDSAVTSRSANGLVQDKHGFYLGVTGPEVFPFALPHGVN
jgi:hypothetical protein